MRHAASRRWLASCTVSGIDADWVLFGHVHRRGLIGDERWPMGRPGGDALLNTGSWVYEPLLVTGATPPHPYWPGGAVLVDADTNPASWDCSTISRGASCAQRRGAE